MGTLNRARPGLSYDWTTVWTDTSMTKRVWPSGMRPNRMRLYVSEQSACTERAKLSRAWAN